MTDTPTSTTRSITVYDHIWEELRRLAQRTGRSQRHCLEQSLIVGLGHLHRVEDTISIAVASHPVGSDFQTRPIPIVGVEGAGPISAHPATTPQAQPAAPHQRPISGLPEASQTPALPPSSTTPGEKPAFHLVEYGKGQQQVVRQAAEESSTNFQTRADLELVPEPLRDLQGYRLHSSVWFPMQPLLDAFQVPASALAGSYNEGDDVRDFDGVPCIDTVVIGLIHDLSKLPPTVTGAINRHLASLTQAALD